MNYKNKKILILGLGLNEGGVGSAKYFADLGSDVLVTDIKDEKTLAPSIEKLKEYPNIKFSLGGHKDEDIDWADVVVRNQAVRPSNKYLMYARGVGKEIKTDVGIFLESVNSKNIIGITGTKGKSTTSCLIYSVLKNAGKKVILTGNIGKSVLDSVAQIEQDTLIVMEISSFQLESFNAKKVSPKFAVITNIYPDHLNYYSSMQDYINAKKLITKFQNSSDFLLLNKDDKTLNSPDFLEGIKAKTIFFSKQDLPENFSPILPGEYNLSNFAAAFALSKLLTLKEDETLKSLKQFKGVEFRMELIKEVNGIKIYNNTTATAPEPAIESLKTFPGCILIAGGMNKGLDYKEFAQAIDKYAKSVYFLEGTATDEIINHLKKLQSPIFNLQSYSSLIPLLNDVRNEAKSKDIILFSPGATSFNLFQNEFDRGRRFNELVERIFK